MKSRNVALELLLADLRADLLAPPPEALAADHIATMRLEEELLESGLRSTPAAAPRRSTRRQLLDLRTQARVRHMTSTKSRIAALLAAMFVLFGNVGPNAAGALPEAFRSITNGITDSIVDTFGVPQSTHSRSAGPATRGALQAIDGARRPSTSGGAATGDAHGPSTTAQPSDASPGVAVQGSPPPTSPATAPGSSPGGPPASVPFKGLKLPPQKNMDRDPSTPPGLPSDWRERALTAALARLQACAGATALAPAGCPQIADLGGATPDTLQWSLVNQPLAGAAVIPRPADDGKGNTQVGAEISVFGLFQMDAAYTLAGDPQVHYAYSSGVAEARMTWSGSAVQNVTFVSGSVADQLPAGLQMPSFERPADVPDIAILVTAQPALQAWATAGGRILVDDPLSDAVVGFDPVHGNFTVTGSYTTTAADGSGPVTSQYTASLLYDGQNLLLLGVSST